MNSSGSSSNSAWCEELYRKKAAEIILYGRALGLSHGEAEDVLQETFVKLLELREEPDQPEHYCLRTFRNRALNHKRTLWRRFVRELEAHRWFERGDSESPMERRIMKCMGELPPEQREVIVLKIWHDYTFEMIARLLEISPNTAAGRYRYGINKLKSCTKGELYERDESTGRTVAILDSATSFITH